MMNAVVAQAQQSKPLQRVAYVWQADEVIR